MSEHITPPDQVDFSEILADFVERLVDKGLVSFDEDGTLDITSKDLYPLEYRAICEGFGFTPDFDPPWDNMLSDDLENAASGFFEVLEEVGAGTTEFWESHFTRLSFQQAMSYWYKLGYASRWSGAKFPYSDGVSAEDFMAMSEDERHLLFERD